MKTMRQLAEEARVAKLELVREQIANGSLTIRQMTPEERLKYPVRTPQNHPAPTVPRP